MFQRKKGAKLTDLAVYENIAAAIFEERLPPGTKLTEDTLAGIFGVSRTLIRNALVRLGHDKIVDLRPNRGAVVASPTAEEARHVFEARQVVEQAIVASAAKRISRQQIVRLQQLTDDERAAHDRGDRRNLVRHSGAFHLELAEIAGNGVLLDFLKDLVSRTSLIIAIKEARLNPACAADEHREIIEALAAANAGRAISLMTRHLAAIEERLNLAEAARPVDLREIFRDEGASESVRGGIVRPPAHLRRPSKAASEGRAIKRSLRTRTA